MDWVVCCTSWCVRAKVVACVSIFFRIFFCEVRLEVRVRAQGCLSLPRCRASHSSSFLISNLRRHAWHVSRRGGTTSSAFVLRAWNETVWCSARGRRTWLSAFPIGVAIWHEVREIIYISFIDTVDTLDWFPILANRVLFLLCLVDVSVGID